MSGSAMQHIVGYQRPTTVAEAVALLDGTRRPIGGGTTVRHDGGGPPVEVVDLQALGLDTIVAEGARVRLGATVSLRQLREDRLVPDMLRDLARAEQPSTLRPLATVGGTVGAADPDSVLLAALLVYDAVVRFADDRDAPLAEVLASGVATGDLIVSVTVETGGRAAIAATGRTPADTPIVAAVARTTDDGQVVALTGIGPMPVIVAPDGIARLEPPGDFRGSSDYRRHLARVLVERAIGELS